MNKNKKPKEKLFKSKMKVDYRGTNELGDGRYNIFIPLLNGTSVEFDVTDLDLSAMMVLFSRILYERQVAYAEDREINVDLVCDLDNNVEVERNDEE